MVNHGTHCDEDPRVAPQQADAQHVSGTEGLVDGHAVETSEDHRP